MKKNISQKKARPSAPFTLNTGPAVVIWSPDFGGHHLLYAGLIAGYLQEQRHRVIFCGPQEALDSTEFAVHLSGRSLEIVVGSSLGECVGRAPSHSIVVVPHADRQLAEMVLLRPPLGVTIRALIMRPSRGVVSKRTRILKLTLTWLIDKRPSISIGELHAIFDNLPSKYFQVPDPALLQERNISRSAARIKLDLSMPEGAILGGILGSISSRKRPELLLMALEKLPDKHHVLVAGSLDGSTSTVVEEAKHRWPDRVHTITGYLRDETYLDCLQAIDYSFVFHQEWISSGVVVNSLAVGTPVLVLSGTPLGEFVVRRRLGVATSATVDGVADGVARVVQSTFEIDQLQIPNQRDFAEMVLGLNFPPVTGAPSDHTTPPPAKS